MVVANRVFGLSFHFDTYVITHMSIIDPSLSEVFNNQSLFCGLVRGVLIEIIEMNGVMIEENQATDVAKCLSHLASEPFSGDVRMTASKLIEMRNDVVHNRIYTSHKFADFVDVMTVLYDHAPSKKLECFLILIKPSSTTTSSSSTSPSIKTNSIPLNEMICLAVVKEKYGNDAMKGRKILILQGQYCGKEAIIHSFRGSALYVMIGKDKVQLSFSKHVKFLNN